MARLCSIFAFLLAGVTLAAEPPGVAAPPRPFMLWSADEASAIRKRVESEPWAAREHAAMLKQPAESRMVMDNLLLYGVMDDRSGVDVEKAALLRFVGCPPYLQDSFDWMWHHVDHYEMALRFDTLYDQLSPSQRSALDQTLRQMAIHGIEKERIRTWDNYSRMASHHLCALATGDRQLIKAIFESPGGLRSYLDSIADDGIPPIGGPSSKNLGHLVIWCNAVRRLGMDELGWGYVSPRGATVRKVLESLWRMADPAVIIPGGTAFYGRSALDERYNVFARPLVGNQPPRFVPFVSPAPVVVGHMSDGTGGLARWTRETGERPDGRREIHFERGSAYMQYPLIFEAAHKACPDAGFDYFLAQLRPPGSKQYVPSLYFGLEPVDADKVKPPGMTSLLLRQRGQALLRMREGPGYWDSHAPAAVVNLAANAGGAGSAMAIQSLYAFGRPIYLCGQLRYERDDPWPSSARAHCTVAVDNMQMGEVPAGTSFEIRPVWPKATPAATVRSATDGPARFVATRSRPTTRQVTDRDGNVSVEEVAMYPGVEMERAVMLTDRYMVDVFRVWAGREHDYHWLVHALGVGVSEAGDAWQPTEDLDSALADTGSARFTDQRVLRVGVRDWSMTAIQRNPFKDPAAARLPKAWYEREVGVRVTMLGEEGTTAYYARTPETTGIVRVKPPSPPQDADPRLPPKRDSKYDQQDRQVTELDVPDPGAKPDLPPPPQPKAPPPADMWKFDPQRAADTGGVSIIAHRRAKATVFVAVHEPFENGHGKIRQVRRIAQTPAGVAVAIDSDRVLVSLGDDGEREVTLAGDGESYTFADHAFVNVGGDAVQVWGDVWAIKIKVQGRPKLLINGTEQRASVSGGVMTFGP